MNTTRVSSRHGRAVSVLVAAGLAFFFVLGLSGQDDPLLARLFAGMAAMATSIAIFLVGEVLFALRGKAGEGLMGSFMERELLAQEKTRLLTAIKEIDFDHAMGKINDKDHLDLRSRYEAQALEIISLLDREEAIFRKEAEALARARIEGLYKSEEARRATSQ